MTPIMFEKLIQPRTRHASVGTGFDPSVFDDPVALETDWTPAASGGASFRTHRLVQPSANRVEFVATLGAKAIYLVFLVSGAGVLLFQFNRIRIAQTGFSDQDTHISGSKSSYTSYELNLVLDDGSRINVVDHGNLDRLRGDATTLSRFLSKPVWDATRGRDALAR